MAARRVDADVTTYEKNTAIMLYDASGFRVEYPVKYMFTVLKRRRSPLYSKLTQVQAEILFYQWWDRTTNYDRNYLANEMVLGFSKRSKMVRSFKAFQEVAEWVRLADLARGVAPSRADIMFQYATTRNLEILALGS